MLWTEGHILHLHNDCIPSSGHPYQIRLAIHQIQLRTRSSQRAVFLGINMASSVILARPHLRPLHFHLASFHLDLSSQLVTIIPLLPL